MANLRSSSISSAGSTTRAIVPLDSACLAISAESSEVPDNSDGPATALVTVRLAVVDLGIVCGDGGSEDGGECLLLILQAVREFFGLGGRERRTKLVLGVLGLETGGLIGGKWTEPVEDDDRLCVSIGGAPTAAAPLAFKGLMLNPASRGSGLKRGDI